MTDPHIAARVAAAQRAWAATGETARPSRVQAISLTILVGIGLVVAGFAAGVATARLLEALS